MLGMELSEGLSPFVVVVKLMSAAILMPVKKVIGGSHHLTRARELVVIGVFQRLLMEMVVVVVVIGFKELVEEMVVLVMMVATINR